MQFSMVVPRRPSSVNARGSASFRDLARRKAQEVYKEEPERFDRLYARIIWFHRDPTVADVDNILKGVFDSLKGIVYDDDKRIALCLVQRIRYTTESYEIASEVEESSIYNEIIDLIGRNRDHIVYIEIGSLERHVVRFVPIL